MPAEGRHLAAYRDSYDTLVFNANTVAHMPGAVAKLVSEGTAKPFIIDPQTHAFQHDPTHIMSQNGGRWALKKSIDKLAEAYGSVIREKAGRQPVAPSDITDAVAMELAEGVLRFQMESVATQNIAAQNSEYLEWMSLDVTTPEVLVAPYFYMDARTMDVWLDVNQRLAQCASSVVRAQYQTSRLFLELVIDRDILLDTAAMDRLADLYGTADCDGVLLWVDGLVEHEAPSGVLSGFVDFAKRIREAGKEVYNLYGGYFSILLSHPDFGSVLSGVCHGMEYGESRAVVPVGGGIPMAKFYFPSLHVRLRYGDAARLFFERGYLDSSSAFYSEVCNCQTCHEVIGDDPQKNFAAYGEGHPVTFRRRGSIVTLSYPNQDTKGRCLSHYLQRKQTEFAAVRNDASADLLDDLLASAEKYRGDLGIESVAHLRVWHGILSTLAAAQQ